MYTLFIKEIQSFLSSLTGYIAIAVFLVATGLFLWVFPGPYNVLEAGYANLDALFILAPWVFMFLVPAVTMRSFSDERRNGTIELLLTKPLSDWQIVMGKYLASIVLVIFALLPTLIYYFTVQDLSAGNIDQGAFWGSYIGLLFLASGFSAIGIFSSSLTDNQIVAFILAVFLSFFCYIGFDQIASFKTFGSLDNIILQLGINEHYISMSRGVIDSRDLLYFLSLIGFFLLSSKLKLESRKW